MPNLQEVIDFIRVSEKQDINEMIAAINRRNSEVRSDIKSGFRVGDTVGINHKTISPDDSFLIVKINNKNIKVKKLNVGEGRVAGIFNVSPHLLVQKKFRKPNA